MDGWVSDWLNEAWVCAEGKWNDERNEEWEWRCRRVRPCGVHKGFLLVRFLISFSLANDRS